MCAFTTAQLYDTWYDLIYLVLFICIQSAAATAATLCVAILLSLPLAAVVCRVAKLVAGSLNLIPVFSFLRSKHAWFVMYPLAVQLSHLRPRFADDTSSVLTGMRGVKAPPQRSSPCSAYDMSVDLRIFAADVWLTLYYEVSALGFKNVGTSKKKGTDTTCLLYTSPSPRDLSTSRMPSSA